MFNYKILIVDDDKLVAWSLSQDLKSDGCEVAVAVTGESAVAAFNKNTPDVVLLDLKLPDIDGLEVLKRLKQVAPEAIVIMMTAYATVQTAVQAVKNGATEFIKKPFTYEELKVILDRALQHHKLSREVAEMRQELKKKHGISNYYWEFPGNAESF